MGTFEVGTRREATEVSGFSLEGAWGCGCRCLVCVRAWECVCVSVKEREKEGPAELDLDGLGTRAERLAHGERSVGES